MSTKSPSPAHAERLRVPLRWWALLTMFSAAVLVAFLVATPLWLALSVAGVLFALMAAVFLGYGAARVAVEDGTLYAGRARIGVEHLGVPVALDAPASRRLAGPDADARAYLLLRAYVKRSVLVPVEDPADPTPYWLVSTRHPDRVAAAILAAREAHPAPRPTDG
ncbi:DUF3093 domain-containing protein [Nocardioides mesophilus]|uniref:DUF3093 domain-containing protein n=1 Tax=Nocardioides mesophilus TaxID=433659 RepID=A0A7G9RBK8_9ACTN|nr:DUF3093 domain-containing protein [Nocardioides mesophilus]QNN52983.1 DUF3093 domain-containing protein [Nocardioides mesophilus]